MSNAIRKITTTKEMIAVLVLLVVGGIASAHASDISATVKVGTLGLGYELEYLFNKKFNARLALSKHEVSKDYTTSGNAYKGELQLKTFGLIGDWHLWRKGFRLSAGAVSNGNELNIYTTGGSFRYNGVDYTGNASAQAKFKSIAPYLGLGWSSQKKRGLSVDFELGALFTGAPLVSASGSTTGAGRSCGFSVNEDGVATVTGDSICSASSTNQAKLKTDLETEHRELQDDLDKLKLYPVLALGIQYRF